jgi:hypothetical protein
MAKSGARGKPERAGLRRKTVVRDEKLLSPVLVDSSTILFSGETAIQDFYQTTFPVGNVPEEGRELEVALVARFAYSPGFLKALMSLLVRQFAASEATRGKKLEAISWLKQLVQQVESGSSPTSSEQTTP